MGAGISNAASRWGNASIVAGQIYNAAGMDGVSGAGTVYTVTTGKTFYMVSCGLTYVSTVGGERIKLYVGGSSNPILQMYTKITPTYYTQDAGHAELTFPIPLVIPSGTVISMYSPSVNNNLAAWVNGWEE